MEKHIYKVVHRGIMGKPKRVTYHEVQLKPEGSGTRHYGEYQSRELARQHGIRNYEQGTGKVKSADGNKVYKPGEFNAKAEENWGVQTTASRIRSRKESVVEKNKEVLKEAIRAKNS